MRQVLFMFLGIILLASSCTSDKVMTSHAIQKRKYRSGLYFSGRVKADQQSGAFQPKSQALDKKTKHSIEIERDAISRSQLLKIEAYPNARPSPDKGKKEKNGIVRQVSTTLKSAKGLVNSSFRKRFRPSQDYYEEQSQPTSQFGISGFTFGLSSLALLIGAFLIQSFWALLLLLFALIFSLFGLINSIKGLKDSYEFDRKGKVYSYIGLFASATVLGISALFLFIVILTLIAFIA